MVRQVESCFGDGGQLAQMLFDQPATGSAADTLHEQSGFSQFPFMLDERLLHLGAIEQCQLIAELGRQCVGIDGGLTAMTVVAFQSASDDRFRNRQATRAAEFATFAENLGCEAAARGNWQRAVIAGEGGAHGRSTSAPLRGSSPRVMVPPGATRSSSNRRQDWPSCSPSNSTKRRPSMAASMRPV
ncbi:hypothetical protein D3C78_681270 [compost metagenome]